MNRVRPASVFDRQWLLYPLLASAATLALHYLAGLRWAWSGLVGFVAWPLIGTLVTIDDDLRGGWSNPDGTVRPNWLQAPFWGQICMGCSVAAFAACLDGGWRSRGGTALAAVGVIAAVAATLLLRRRSYE